MHKKILQLLISFEWDASNQHKSWKKHGITQREAEEAFISVPLLVYDDEKHSDAEKRYYLLGKTQENKKLFVVFTIRDNRIRVVSARAMSRVERKFYEIEERKINS